MMIRVIQFTTLKQVILAAHQSRKSMLFKSKDESISIIHTKKQRIFDSRYQNQKAKLSETKSKD